MSNQNRTIEKYDNKLSIVLHRETVQEQFKNALGENKDLFIASLISVVSNNDLLQKCDHKDIIREALRAAVLKLPIEPSLGYAYLAPFRNGAKSKAEKREVYDVSMLPGYKGIIQLCLRTGQFKTINAGAVFEGETVIKNRLTGEVQITGEPRSEKEIGYFAYFELINGYKKADYWTVKKIMRHAKQYAPSYESKSSAWVKDFSAMAIKTVLDNLLDKYAPKSVDFIFNQPTLEVLSQDNSSITKGEIHNDNDERIKMDEQGNEIIGEVVSMKQKEEPEKLNEKEEFQSQEAPPY